MRGPVVHVMLMNCSGRRPPSASGASRAVSVKAQPSYAAAANDAEIQEKMHTLESNLALATQKESEVTQVCSWRCSSHPCMIWSNCAEHIDADRPGLEALLRNKHIMNSATVKSWKGVRLLYVLLSEPRFQYSAWMCYMQHRVLWFVPTTAHKVVGPVSL